MALDAFESDEPGGGDFLRCAVRLGGQYRDALGRAGPHALAAVTRWLELRKTLKVENINGAPFPGRGQAGGRRRKRSFPAQAADSAGSRRLAKTEDRGEMLEVLVAQLSARVALHAPVHPEPVGQELAA
jgi:hypothetical protein